MTRKHLLAKYNAFKNRYNSLFMSIGELFGSSWTSAKNRRDLLALFLGLLVVVNHYQGKEDRGHVFGRSEKRPQALLVEQGRLRLVQPVTTEPTDQSPTVPARFTPFFFQPLPINTAEADLLAILPGVGEKTAQKIIRFRKEAGPFKSGEDLEKIPGIGMKRRLQLEKYLSFGL